MGFSSLTLTSAELEALFPFYFVIDTNCHLVSWGQGIQDLPTTPSVGMPISELFQLESPVTDATFSALVENHESHFQWKHEVASLRLFGKVIYGPEKQTLLFLGNPSFLYAETQPSILRSADSCYQQFLALQEGLKSSMIQASRLAQIANTINNMIVIIDQNNQIEWVNNAFINITTFTLDELKQTSFFDFLATFPPSSAVTKMRSAVVAKQEFQIELQYQNKVGDIYWLDVHGKPSSDDKLHPTTQFTLVLTDITGRKAVETSLKESEAAFRSVVESIGEALMITDFEDCITYANSRVSGMTGYLPEELIGQKVHELFIDPSEWLEMEIRNQQRSRGYTEQYEIKIYRKDHSVMWVMVNATPYINSEGDIVGTLGALTDITERKEAEQELKRAKEIAEAADRAKSQFLANMSHEIRTPLNGIVGMASLLQTTPLLTEQRGYLDVIIRSSDSLLFIINDILDFSKIEAEQLQLEAIPFNLRECVEDALDLQSAEAGKRPIDLAYFIHEDVPTMIVGDEVRFRQILINLVSNAVKFTYQGEVSIIVSGEWISNHDYRIHVKIRDTGIGIAPEHLPRLFQAFNQIDSSMTRKYGGTGLGLAISKRLIELMGGRIWVESIPLQGSTFFFDILVQVEEKQPKLAYLHTPPPTTFKNRRILIVDDNKTNRLILARQIEAWGLIAFPVPSGHEALQLLKKFQVDAAILDVYMPEMDGLTLAKEIEINYPTLPIIIFSSAGRSLIAPHNLTIFAYLHKPLKPSLLYNILVRLFSQKEEIPNEDAQMNKIPVLADHLPLSILVAEDNRINQLVISNLLRRLGYEADIVENGRQVLEIIRKHTYDVVLMDIQMPEMDGVESTRELIYEWGNKRPYIIAVTAHALQGDRAKYLRLGMDGYISKPILLDALTKALQEVKPRHQYGAEAFIDMKLLRSQFEQSAEEMLHYLIPVFLEESTPQLDRMRIDAKMGNYQAVWRMAHTLKGSSGSIGLVMLADILAEVEKAAKLEQHEKMIVEVNNASALYNQFQSTWGNQKL